MKVKICGLKNLDDFRYCRDKGASLLGFINIDSSRRFIEFDQLKDLSQKMSKEEREVSVLLVKESNEIKLLDMLAELGFGYIQNYGSLTKSEIDAIKKLNVKIILPIQISTEKEVEAALEKMAEIIPLVDYIIFDSKSSDTEQLGGTGVKLDIDLFNFAREKFSNLNKNIILSGGLNPANLNQSIKASGIGFIDLSSGIEGDKPGCKDLNLVDQLFAELATCSQ